MEFLAGALIATLATGVLFAYGLITLRAMIRERPCPKCAGLKEITGASRARLGLWQERLHEGDSTWTLERLDNWGEAGLRVFGQRLQIIRYLSAREIELQPAEPILGPREIPMPSAGAERRR